LSCYFCWLSASVFRILHPVYSHIYMKLIVTLPHEKSVSQNLTLISFRRLYTLMTYLG